MTDFLLELLSEEIPARMQARARQDLARLFEEQIGAAGLKAETIETWSTPRRLALVARGLPIETSAVEEERKGPRADAPAQAIEGFLKSTGLTREQLVEREDKKGGKVLFALISKPGRATRDVLAEAVPAIIRAFRQLATRHRGEQTAEVTSAHPLTEEQVVELKQQLRQRIGREVAIDLNVDPEILGGLVVRIGSQMIDSSIRTRLNALASAMKG